MRGRLVWGVLALALLPLSVQAGSPLAVVCSVDAPVVGPHDNVRANVYAVAPDGESLTYKWKASGGSLDPTDKSEVKWNPNGAAAGTFTLSVEIAGSAGDSGGCSVLVIAASSNRSAAPNASAGFTRQVRAGMLFKGKTEEPHFGLYSYLLLGGPVNDTNRERYRIFLNTFLTEVLRYDPLSKEFTPPKLNITYLPVTSDLPASFNVDWVLAHYDYERAQGLMSRFSEIHGAGPFIISVAQPLSSYEPGSDPKPHLLEDLSTVPVSVVNFWVEQFLVQTAQDRWDSATLSGLAVRMRTAIEVAAIGSSEVRASVAALFK